MELPGATILIIDDEEVNVYKPETLLEKTDWKFIRVTSGKAGLTMASDHSIDLVILNVKMADMHGFEIAEILKSNKHTKEIPILFVLEEKKEVSSILNGFEEGSVDYLFKPLNAELTRAKIAVMLKVQLQKKELLEKSIALQKKDAQINLLNIELKQRLHEIEAINKELESFSYSVSHDLRAPLRSIIGYSTMLEEDHIHSMPEDAKQLLDRIQKNALRMNTLMDDLLALSRLEKASINKTEIDMLHLVQQAINHLSTRIDKNEPTIKIDSLCHAYADRSLLHQVWINLISNAIKYSSKKEDPVIEIGCTESENEVVFYVKDNGAGFNMEYSNRLFGVFQRLHKSEDFEGTGVGLAMVRRIIGRHNGRVWAEGKVNEGATFYFSLPMSINKEIEIHTMKYDSFD